MKMSRMALSIQPSLTRKLFDKAKQYENVIDFTLGDPDYILLKLCAMQVAERYRKERQSILPMQV